MFVGNRHGIEYTLVKKAGYDFRSVPTGKRRRGLHPADWLKNAADALQLAAGVVVAWRLLGRERPVLVFCKGGPPALPVGLAARARRVPIVIHESDAVISAANGLIARFAVRVLTAFPAACYPLSLAAKIETIGVPLRREFCRRGRSNSHRSTLLVLGGSQGAVSINDRVISSLPRLLAFGLTVIHVCGPNNQSVCLAARETLSLDLAARYRIVGYSERVDELIREATVVVSRAGSQIFEIATIGRPMILIPLPWAAHNHQVANAEYFARHGAAIVLRQDNLTSEKLCETIESLFRQPKARRVLREGTRQFNCCASAAKAVNAIVHALPQI